MLYRGRRVASSLLHLVAEALSVCFENGRTQHAFPGSRPGHVVDHFRKLAQNCSGTWEGMASNGEK
jgi:hypothetical protein